MGTLVSVKYCAWVLKDLDAHVWVYIGPPESVQKEVQRLYKEGHSKITYRKVVG